MNFLLAKNTIIGECLMLLQVTCDSRKEETCKENKFFTDLNLPMITYLLLFNSKVTVLLSTVHMKSSSISSSGSGIGSGSGGSSGSCSGSSSSSSSR